MPVTAEFATRLAGVALGHVEREYPHKLDHTLSGPLDVRTPSSLHPIFYGSYDWHSCVHGYWLLTCILRNFPNSPRSAEIAALFDRRITSENVAVECGYFTSPSARGFERPYGWAWLLKLAAEVAQTPWFATLSPLAEIIAQRLRDFLPLSRYPVRVGTHFNTAFALRMAADYAEATADRRLLALLCETCERWYGYDVGCTAWGEPSGDDFHSSALVEAECMRRLAPPERFLDWFGRFLPDIADRRPTAVFSPAFVADRSDGKIAHLDGLNLSRAWCFRSLSHALPAHDSRAAIMRDAADDHLAASLPHIAGDYMGEHWLGSFALLALQA